MLAGATYGLVQAQPDGTAVLPLGRVAWKPNVSVLVWPAPMVPLKETLRAVTVWPLTVTVAFHEPDRVCPAGNVNVTVQPLMVELPLLVMLTG